MNSSTMRRLGAAFVVLASLVFAAPGVSGVRPDDRSGVRGIGSPVPSAQARPDDRAGYRGIDLLTPAQSSATSVVSRTGDGFDWGAAGAGAGSAAGVVLLLMGATLTRRRIRHGTVVREANGQFARAEASSRPTSS